MTSELPGFSFDSISRSEPDELLKISEDSSCKIFEISPDGVVKIHGYSVDEVAMLLEAYRHHVTAFAQGMQALVPAPDAVRYRPEEP